MKKIYEKALGEDLLGSIRLGLAFAKDDCYGCEPRKVRIHPLDCALTQWPYGWPPVETDEGCPRRVALIEMSEPGGVSQLQLL